jgi:hypothetical protein
MAETPQDPPPKSFGNMSEAHWSKARKDANPEAMEYLRERSHAPGVAEGGGSRNFYCMQCDGVIPHDGGPRETCPHCGATLDESVKRYFNWVEMNDPPKSDLRALVPFFLGALVIVGLVGWLVWSVWPRRG